MNRRKWIVALFVITAIIDIALIMNITYKTLQVYNLQKGIANELIRFHVRANSDTKEDQHLKLKVRDEVIKYIEPYMSTSQSIDESRSILEKHSEAIKKVAIDTLTNNNSNYSVNVYFENSYFPIKSYGNVTLPPGIYEAFRIDIGAAAGKNWWCVLYPPLCFVDATHGEFPEQSKDTLTNILDEEEYNAITSNKLKLEFRYLTFLNELID